MAKTSPLFSFTDASLNSWLPAFPQPYVPVHFHEPEYLKFHNVAILGRIILGVEIWFVCCGWISSISGQWLTRVTTTEMPLDTTTIPLGYTVTLIVCRVLYTSFPLSPVFTSHYQSPAKDLTFSEHMCDLDIKNKYPIFTWFKKRIISVFIITKS